MKKRTVYVFVLFIMLMFCSGLFCVAEEVKLSLFQSQTDEYVNKLCKAVMLSQNAEYKNDYSAIISFRYEVTDEDVLKEIASRKIIPDFFSYPLYEVGSLRVDDPSSQRLWLIRAPVQDSDKEYRSSWRKFYPTFKNMAAFLPVDYRKLAEVNDQKVSEFNYDKDSLEYLMDIYSYLGYGRIKRDVPYTEEDQLWNKYFYYETYGNSKGIQERSNYYQWYLDMGKKGTKEDYEKFKKNRPIINSSIFWQELYALQNLIAWSSNVEPYNAVYQYEKCSKAESGDNPNIAAIKNKFTAAFKDFLQNNWDDYASGLRYKDEYDTLKKDEGKKKSGYQQQNTGLDNKKYNNFNEYLLDKTLEEGSRGGCKDLQEAFKKLQVFTSLFQEEKLAQMYKLTHYNWDERVAVFNTLVDTSSIKLFVDATVHTFSSYSERHLGRSGSQYTYETVISANIQIEPGKWIPVELVREVKDGQTELFPDERLSFVNNYLERRYR